MANWLSIALALTAVASCVGAFATPGTVAATTTTASTDVTHTATTPAPHHPPRIAEVIVIDLTKNTSTVVTILIDPEVGNATAQQEQQARNFLCMKQVKANLFLLVHLNRNWRQKLSFVRSLISGTYKQGSTNVVVVFFNAFINILATFGTDPLTSEGDVMLALARVQTAMERDENAAVTEHWVQFYLGDALRNCFRYAQLFLRQFSLDARPSFFVSYFDESAVISEAAIDDAEKVLRQFKLESLFNASISVLQLPGNMPVPPLLARVSELLSSSPNYQLTGPSEASLLSQLAELAAKACNQTAPVV